MPLRKQEQKHERSNRIQHKRNDLAQAGQLTSGRVKPDAAAKPQIKGWHYSMFGHVEKAIEKYCELANVKEKDLEFAAMPHIDDHQIPFNEFNVKGKLSPICARIVQHASSRSNCLLYTPINLPSTLKTLSTNR